MIQIQGQDAEHRQCRYQQSQEANWAGWKSLLWVSIQWSDAGMSCPFRLLFPFRWTMNWIPGYHIKNFAKQPIMLAVCRPLSDMMHLRQTAATSQLPGLSLAVAFSINRDSGRSRRKNCEKHVKMVAKVHNLLSSSHFFTLLAQVCSCQCGEATTMPPQRSFGLKIPNP